MASSRCSMTTFYLAGIALFLNAIHHPTFVAADADPLHDVANSNFTAADFAIYNLAAVDKTTVILPAGNITATSVGAMPGAATQGLGQVVYKLNPGAILPPAWHPRGSELAYITQGTAQVGFIDGSNNARITDVSAGGAFMFPRGLIHWIENIGPDVLIVNSAYNGEDKGTTFLNRMITKIPPRILRATFGVKNGRLPGKGAPQAALLTLF